MTDGIIQQAFAVLEQELIGRGFNPNGEKKDVLVFTIINVTQQELIEKIKQSYTDYRADWLTILIGDNIGDNMDATVGATKE